MHCRYTQYGGGSSDGGGVSSSSSGWTVGSSSESGSKSELEEQAAKREAEEQAKREAEEQAVKRESEEQPSVSDDVPPKKAQKVCMYIRISSSDLAEEQYVGTQKEAYKRAKKWLSDTKKKLSLDFNPEFEEDEVEWKTTLEGGFHCEEPDKLKAKLLQEFKQRFNVELGGNCVDLSLGHGRLSSLRG
jgi:hypothetical protein